MKRLLLLAMLAILSARVANADLPGYLAAKDDSYSFTRIGGSTPDAPVQYDELYMVSQTWHGIVWKHKLIIVRPNELPKSTPALLVISGGSWRDGKEKELLDKNSGDLKIGLALASSVKMPIALLQQVPFQPVFNGLKEDQIIAHTFDQYLTTGEEDWPLLLPMTKAAVRAMDTVQTFAKQQWQTDVTKFVVTGASKRGWTTWLTGASDPRVAAIAPMVIDVLNMGAQMKKQKEDYGAFSEQVGDYTRLKVQERMDTDAGHKLLAMVDPYAYRAKLTMPKMILLGTNDPYWTVDALNLYFDGLPGEKHILYVPNSGHGLNDMTRVLAGVSAMALETTGQLKLPDLEWTYADVAGGVNLSISSDIKPTEVATWQADSTTRDFRQSTWRRQPAPPDGPAFKQAVKSPTSGYSAVYGEAIYDIAGRRFYLSTTIRVIGGPAKAN